MKRVLLKLIHFWNEDRSLLIALLSLLLFIFVFVPLLKREGGGEILIKITYSVLLLTGILSVVRNKMFVIVVSFFAVIGLFANWLSDDESTRTVLVKDFGAILFNFFFAIAILIKTFQPGDITFYRIQGSIIVYLLFGLIFAYVFHAIYFVSGPTSFNNIKSPDIKEFLYYSFTTLTTMGYGDITPVSPLARSMANFEALVGQLYPAILIARLVSMEFETSKSKKERV